MPPDPALIQRLVEVEAVKQGLDPQYAAAVARQESGFNPLQGAIPRSLLRDRSVALSCRYPVACCGGVQVCRACSCTRRG
jgi:hypothetical protein